MWSFIKNTIEDVFGLFYPNICLACSQSLLQGEKVICLHCAHEMPQNNHWNHSENSLMMRLTGRVNVQAAAAFLQFTKASPVQHLIHELKYNKRQDVGEYIGQMFGHKLILPESIIQNIDLIVPVPLHWKKLKTRGYNQCDSFAKGLSEIMNVPWSAETLQRNYENISQTKKKRYDRWGNVEEIFGVKDETLLQGKHILLVDDVVTTGATSETCLQTILTVADTKVSFVAMAMAKRR